MTNERWWRRDTGREQPCSEREEILYRAAFSVTGNRGPGRNLRDKDGLDGVVSVNGSHRYKRAPPRPAVLLMHSGVGLGAPKPRGKIPRGPCTIPQATRRASCRSRAAATSRSWRASRWQGRQTKLFSGVSPVRGFGWPLGSASPSSVQRPHTSQVIARVFAMVPSPA